MRQNKYGGKTVEQIADANAAVALTTSSTNIVSESTFKANRDITKDLSELTMYLRNKKGYTLKERTINYNNKTIKIINKQFGIEYSIEWVDMVRTKLTEKGRKKNSINSYLCTIQNLFNANGHGDIKVALLKKTKQRVEKLIHSKSEIDKMLVAAEPNVRDFAILNVLWYAALRRGEVVHLRVSDFMRDDKGRYYIEVRDNGEGVKDYESRKIPIEQPCVDAINIWLKARGENGITEDKYPHMFISLRDGKPLNDFRIYALVNKYAIKAGIQPKKPEWKESTPHAWRRSRCTYLLNKENVPPTIVQKIMGHSNLETTMEYCQVDDDTLFEHIEKIDGRNKYGQACA